MVKSTQDQKGQQQEQEQEPWFLKSSCPVFFPEHPALTVPQAEFDVFLQSVKPSFANEDTQADQVDEETPVTDKDTETVIISDVSTTADIREDLSKMGVDISDAEGEEKKKKKKAPTTPENDHPFMRGLLAQPGRRPDPITHIQTVENKMLTENRDIAFRSTTEPLVDLFQELEDVISGPRLLELLQAAWQADPATTLKVIFNSRSIHLGKASRHTFYRCAGWLAKYHPQTLLVNLAWLSRPVIEKKVEKKSDEQMADEADMVFVDVDEDKETDESDPARFDVRNGVSHGYWKDLLNLLALHVSGHLDVLTDPHAVLNIYPKKAGRVWPKTQEAAAGRRVEQRKSRHDVAINMFEQDPVHRALHITVARLFAAQLRTDLALLRSEKSADRRRVSLCAKWTPSAERFHDKHTFVVSSIAEILHPFSEFETVWVQQQQQQNYGHDQYTYDPYNREHRELYLRLAREAYRKDVSALRKHLECVERDITAKTYAQIRYERVPSIAMNNYAPLFGTKDPVRFEKYIERVASGKSRISGATLLPSTLIMQVRVAEENRKQAPRSFASFFADMDAVRRRTGGMTGRMNRKGTKKVIDAKVEEINGKVLDGQWNALVQRIKDSGTLENCIAVADVSGSMYSPIFPDRSCPMDSSIGLSLLIAEVAKPPFGGAFITFATNPTVQRIDLSMSIQDKCSFLQRADWAGSTDIVAVFEKLILPMAIENKLRQEDMVKRIFVFSDMQFNAANPCLNTSWSGPNGQGARRDDAFSSSYERIQDRYREAGYEMPELIFWNLAGGRSGYVGARYGSGDPVAPKPVTATEQGTALVSGYSQGMLKVFLDNGSFREEEGQEEIVQSIGEGGEVVVNKLKRRKLDPLNIVKKATCHPAYDMLRVVD